MFVGPFPHTTKEEKVHLSSDGATCGHYRLCIPLERVLRHLSETLEGLSERAPRAAHMQTPLKRSPIYLP